MDALNTTRQNIEFKARFGALDAAEAIARSLGAAYVRTLVQTDTFYQCSHGRLKLRQEGSHAELIWYARADLAAARASEYRIVPEPDACAMDLLLATALARTAIVRKTRRLFMLGSTRIHLDDVEQLGTFIEFEFVLSSGEPAGPAYEQLAMLKAAFNIADGDIVPQAYADLLAGLPRREA